MTDPVAWKVQDLMSDAACTAACMDMNSCGCENVELDDAHTVLAAVADHLEEVARNTSSHWAPGLQAAIREIRRER